MENFKKHLTAGVLAAIGLIISIPVALADVSLGAASGFAVLGGENVTCTASLVGGNVGVSPAGAVPFTNTGCTINGAIPPATDAAAATAQVDLHNTYTSLQSLTCTQLPGSTLAGENLAPGVYCVDSTAKTGTLTLTGSANSEWIFLVDGELTGTDFSVVMAGGGQPCNVYWASSVAVTMTNSALKGNVIACSDCGGAITMTGGSLVGRVLGHGSVTLTGTTITGCNGVFGPGDNACKLKKPKNPHPPKPPKTKKPACNQGVGNGPEGCDPGNSNHNHSSNDENGGTPGNPGRKGGNQ